jgi:hypothetical protein
MADLDVLVRGQMNKYLRRLEESLPKTVSDSLVGALNDEVLRLGNQVENRKQTVDRLENMLRSLNGVAP